MPALNFYYDHIVYAISHRWLGLRLGSEDYIFSASAPLDSVRLCCCLRR